MKSDFELITHKFDKPIKIYPIADVHYGAINHNREAWEQFVRTIEQDENSYLILNGDLINNNTRSAVGSPFDDFTRPREQKAAMTEFLSPIKDKILCMTSGNHEQRSLKDADDDPAYDIACKLDIEDIFRPNACFMKVSIGKKDKGHGRVGSRQSYVFAVTHGSGGGVYTGATVNRNERWGNVIDGADCIVIGHTHKGTVTRPSKIIVDTTNNLVTERDYLVISCVAWQNYGEYALKKMLLPTKTSHPQILYLEEREHHITVTW